MSNRKRTYTHIGSGWTWTGERHDYRCDGRTHWLALYKPKRQLRSGPCNCAQMQRVVGDILKLRLI